MNVTHDSDPEETREWLEALKAAVASGGRDRGLFLLTQLEQQAQQLEFRRGEFDRLALRGHLMALDVQQ